MAGRAFKGLLCVRGTKVERLGLPPNINGLRQPEQRAECPLWAKNGPLLPLHALHKVSLRDAHERAPQSNVARSDWDP